MATFHFCAQHQQLSGHMLVFDGILTGDITTISRENYPAIKTAIANQMSSQFCPGVAIPGEKITVTSLTKM